MSATCIHNNRVTPIGTAGADATTVTDAEVSAVAVRPAPGSRIKTVPAAIPSLAERCMR